MATYLLLALLGAVFLYSRLEMAPWQRELLDKTGGLVPSRLVGDFGAAWPTLISHVFLHGSLLHLLSNCLFLWVFGRAVEAELRWAFVPVFLLLGAVAGLGSTLLRWDSDVPGIGASGAISGLLGTYLVLFPTAGVRLLIFAWAPVALIFGGSMPTIDVPAWVFLPLWLAMQVFGGLGEAFSPSGVDYGAHLAGFLGGYALILLLRRGFGLWPDQYGLRLGWDPLLQPAPPRRGAIVATRRRLPPGHVLARDDLQIVRQDRGYVDPDPVLARDLSKVIGRRLRVERYRYEPLLWSDLEPAEQADTARTPDPALSPERG